MKKYFAYLYLFAPAALALAHGGVDDGDGPDLPITHPSSEKMYVGIAFGGVLAACIVWWIWSKKKGM